MKVVGYFRVDPGDGSWPGDPAALEQRIEREAAQRGWDLVAIHDDRSSGRSLADRPGLSKALRLLEARQADVLFAPDVRHITTSAHEFVTLLYAAQRRGWDLATASEGIDTSDPGGAGLVEAVAALAPRIRSVTVDCHDPAGLSDFWAAATGYVKEAAGEPGAYAVLSDPGGGGPILWFNKVPEPKLGKNRVHLDLNVGDLRAEEHRLMALGARKSEEHTSPSGKAWTVMLDPEGNEFCLVRVTRTISASRQDA